MSAAVCTCGLSQEDHESTGAIGAMGFNVAFASRNCPGFQPEATPTDDRDGLVKVSAPVITSAPVKLRSDRPIHRPGCASRQGFAEGGPADCDCGPDECECGGSGLYPNEVPGVGTEWVSCLNCDVAERAVAVPAAGMTDEAAYRAWSDVAADGYDGNEHRAFLAGRRSMREDTV